MHTLSDLKKAVKAAEGTVEKDGESKGWQTYQLIAPPGQVWKCNRLHALVCEWDNTQVGWRGWRADSIADAIGRMSDGVEPCDDNDCEDCITREPLPAPFPVGTRLRYHGTRVTYMPKKGAPRPHDREKRPEDWEVIIGKGLEVTIDDVHLGRQGTGRVISVDPVDGYEIIDSSKDGSSVYHTKGGNGRLIYPEDAKDWEIIK